MVLGTYQYGVMVPPNNVYQVGKRYRLDRDWLSLFPIKLTKQQPSPTAHIGFSLFFDRVARYRM